MNVELTLQIASAPGIQLRVVNRLKELGLICTKRTLKDAPYGDATRYLILELDGPEVDRQAVVEKLRAVPGIISFDRFGDSEQATEEAVAEDPVQVQEENDEVAEEGGDAEIRDRMLIFSLLSRYPKLGGRLHEITSSIPPEERLSRSLELGNGFGSYLSKQYKSDSPANELSDALANLVVPAISPMAQVHLKGNVLTVSNSKVNLKPKEPKEECCQFMLGTLRGLISSLQSHKYKVDKACCVMEGAEVCDFIFAEA